LNKYFKYFYAIKDLSADASGYDWVSANIAEQTGFKASGASSESL